jgi:hypothetical protein
MSSKVKCTCGWSWNKSDSSKKDMYVCHECGRDNSNNMKNGGWLDNYGEEENANESSVSLPDGYVGMGNDTQGRKSSPAWGGQFQSGGELLQSKESTSVNKKPFNKKELQNIIKDETERTRTGYVKNYRAEANKIEKFLPTKETVDFFNKIKKDAGPELFTALLNIQNKQGNPSINVGTNKGLPFHNRKNYNPFTNEVNIPNSPEILDDIYNYLSEVSHANQSLSEVIPKFLKNDIPGYLKAFTSKGETSENVQKYVYDNPNTVENYTHGKIEPSLINQIENYDYSNHWPISKEEESREYNLIENKLKSGNKNLQMGGSIPGAVGFSYARTNSPAPSEGKYAKKTMASAQDGSKVKYGTPEYEEAYNKGEVLSSTGERSPITLDEVTVQNTYKKDKNWLEQYADKITEENKDAGVMGAIFGTPLSAVTSLPQMFATKSITGEMQRPSEAMDIQNPYGAMAVDAFLDPTNLIGAGLLTKENALSKLATIKKSKILPKLSKSLEIGPLPKNTDVTPWYSNIKNKIFGEPNLDKSYIHDDIKQMVQTDEGRKRLINMGVDPSKIRKLLIIESPSRVEWPSVKSVSKHPIGSHYSPKKNQIVMDAGDLSNPYADMSIGQTREHEVGHWLQDAFIKQSGNREKFLNKMVTQGKLTKDRADELLNFDTKNFATPIDEELINLFPKDAPMKGKWNSRITNPINYFHREYPGYIYSKAGNNRNIGTQMKLEPLAYAREFRTRLVESGYLENKYDPITEDMVNDFLQKDLKNADVEDGMSRISSFATPKEVPKLTNILNRLPAAVPVAVGLGAASQMEKQKDGGIIKDDRGQWDHPGEITEIGSNDITMEGVPYDVLGISDTGDAKLMKPGKNYKFKGKKVTEYPMAKNGMRQEQKGLQNLDNLTNFTNYNTKQPGGWLDQFN